MKFYPCSTDAANRIKFLFYENKGESITLDHHLNKIDLCNYEILIISTDPPNIPWISKYPFDFKMILNIFNAWRVISENKFRNSPEVNSARETINRLGIGIPIFEGAKSESLYLFNNGVGKLQYFLLLPNNSSNSFPLFELLTLSNLYQLSQNSFPIHSSGIVHKEKLFLFCGPSGAGKSTISLLSANQGDMVLDEDQLLLTPGDIGYCDAQAWGYSLQKTNAPLTAVFKLVQDNQDRLIPLSRSQTASFLMERTVDVLGFNIVNNCTINVFFQVARLARLIPGYELHFTKSPDFWDLIDAEFGD